MTERERRLAENEALYREINERITEMIETHMADGDHQAYDYVCECADANCVERIQLTLAQYEDIRADPRRFVIRPGHERPEVEIVVDRADAYTLVTKIGEAGEFAERHDPRDQL